MQAPNIIIAAINIKQSKVILHGGPSKPKPHPKKPATTGSK